MKRATKSTLTSMPIVGMSVTISNSRQKAKKMYPSIAKVLLQCRWRLMRRCRQVRMGMAAGGRTETVG